MPLVTAVVPSDEIDRADAGVRDTRHGDGQGIAVDVGGGGDAERAGAGVFGHRHRLVGGGDRGVVHRGDGKGDGLAVGAAVAVVDGVAERAGGAVGVGDRAEQQAREFGRGKRHAVGHGGDAVGEIDGADAGVRDTRHGDGRGDRRRCRWGRRCRARWLPESSATVTVLSASATGASFTGVTFNGDGLAVGAAVAVVDRVAERAGGAVGVGDRTEQQARKLGRGQASCRW